MNAMNNQLVNPCADAGEPCEQFPELKQLVYCYGQMLGPQDFIDQQDYFLQKIAMLNRCLHGYGVQCGLEVKPFIRDTSGEECPPDKDGNEKEKLEGVAAANEEAAMDEYDCLEVCCGLALDKDGHELVVRHPIRFNVWDSFDDERSREAFKEGKPVYVVICYARHKTGKQRLEVNDDCRDCNDYRQIYTRLYERPCVKITALPSQQQTCDPCCDPIEQECVWLAKLVYRGEHEIEIDNSIRRALSVYEPTTITGVNWVHGARYTEYDAEQRLKYGLDIKFSRRVKANTFNDGIVDVWVTDDWASGHGEFKCFPISIPKGQQLTDTLHIDLKKWSLKPEDRILIIIRTDFILDECCQPVDGNHVGGWVPLLPPAAGEENTPEYLVEQRIETDSLRCPTSARLSGRWTSGNGSPGGTFESWFFVEAEDRNNKKERDER
jgi:hypothetical protein